MYRGDLSSALLLRAALGEEREAAAAWIRWVSVSDLDRIDRAGRSLLPLIHSRVPAAALGERAARLRGIHRFHWTRNQFLVSRLDTALERLTRVGIRPVMVSGPAIAARWYPDMGSRPIEIVDLLVDPLRVAESASLLAKLDWTPARSARPAAPRPWNPVTLGSGAGWCLRLHAARTPEANLEPIEVGSLRAVGLDATAMLLAICGGGRRFREWSRPTWIPDAILVLRGAGGTIDWTRIVRGAAAGRVALVVRERLRHLREIGLASMPAEASGCIERLRPGALERVEALVRRHGVARRTAGLGLGVWRRLAALSGGHRPFRP